MGKKKKRVKKRTEASMSKNRDINYDDIAEYFSTHRTPISAHQCMVTLTTAPIEGKSACSARELEKYEDVRGVTNLEDSGFMEVEMRNGL